MKALFRRIRQILRDRRTRRIFTRFVSTVAAIVVFATTYALVLPAITMESRAECGIEAHQHDESCYTDVLVCEIPESPGHVHDESCYSTGQKLVCRTEEHMHEPNCYDENGQLICGKAEHQHGEDCFEEEQELVCGLTESDGHQHDDSCYQKVLTCGKEAHTHSAACYHVDSAGQSATEAIAVASTESAAAGENSPDGGLDVGPDAAAEYSESETSPGASTSSAGNSAIETGPDSSTSSAENSAFENSSFALTDEAGADYSGARVSAGASTGSAADTAASAGTSTGSAADTAASAGASTGTAAGTAESAGASTGSAADTGASSAAGYVPVLDELDFDTLLNKFTGIYYSRPDDTGSADDGSADTGSADDGSADAGSADDGSADTGSGSDADTESGGTDTSAKTGEAREAAAWNRADRHTELTESDKLTLYLAYTVPAGSLNETNQTARYRLPANVRLTDEQVNSINTTVNGITAQYVSYDTLEILDQEMYEKYLGIEAVEGTRAPSDDLSEYLADHGGQEFISATVKVENVYDEETGALKAQEMVFTFAPYTIQKNQHQYDTEGQPIKAGEEVKGWLAVEIGTEQIEWEEADGEVKAADILFVEKDKKAGLEEISTELRLIETADDPDAGSKNTADADGPDAADADKKQDGTKDSGAEDGETENGESDKAGKEPVSYPSVSFDDSITVAGGSLSTDADAVSGDERLTAETEITVRVEADKGTFPEGTTMVLSAVSDDRMSAVAQAVEGAVDSPKTMGFHAVDISFRNAEGKEIEPLKSIRVSMTSDAIKRAVEDVSTAPVVVHVSDPAADGTAPDRNTDDGDRETTAVPDENSDNGDSESAAGADGNTEDEDSDSAAAADAVEGAEDRHGPEPSESMAEQASENSQEAPAAPTATVIEASTGTDEGQGDTLTFKAEDFSVYAVVYTVDFHWEVNGKMYDFSIPGGGFVSLEHLVEVLGIASVDENTENEAENAEKGAESGDEFAGDVQGEDVSNENGEDSTDEAAEGEASPSADSSTYEEAIKLNEIEVSEATKKFVADVERVEFSNPELVWVGKVDEATTVGGLKEANGLEVEYSAELTEEQIAEINAQTVEAGDWALICVQPFASEETLTVTMTNGDQLVVKVTDGQDAIEVADIDTDGFYVLYVDRYYNNTHHYYALRNDGASVAVPNNNLDALGGEYVWQFGYDGTACWWYNGSNYIEPEWSKVVDNNPDGKYLWIEKRGSGFGIHGNYWSDNYLSWDSSNGFKIVNTGFDVPIKVYERDKPRLNFSVAVNNQSYGSVSCSNTVTDLNWKNTAPIVATPADGCYFVGWHRGDEVLTGYSSTIPVGGIDITADNQVLTAVFGKNYTSPATQEINEWVDSLLGNPLESGKTAHVHDYDNRIYEIDLSASSSRYTIDQDIRIEFITDISRSMYFPETLLNEQEFRVNGQINLGQWLLDNGDPNQVYYVIGDINNTATMYAVYFSGNNYFTRWSIVDASYYLPYDNASTSGRIKTVCEISNGRTTINMTDRFDGNANRIFTGKIYNSTPKPPKDTADWDRLSYLTAAVNAVSRAIYRLDPGAEIGLVTFASSASGGTLYGAEDEASLISALQSIQPVGGTNQTSAFNLINNSNPPVFSLNSGKRQVALLITDGAPQGTTWEAIERAAGVTEEKDVEIWTLGLALDRVGNNKQRLMDLASDGGYSGNAEDPDQLVTETKKILQEMLVKATVIGEVYDTVDPAFYPVDSSGNPIEEGFYYADTAGGSVTCHSAAPSDVKKSYYHWVNDNGTWSIAYYNQEIKWPEDGGWKESFYVKAKEDFMGGNAISTNSGVDNRVEANRVKHSGSPEGYYWLNQDQSSFRVDYETPYVNVDELSMTENSTEWTVYLGTEVDPEEELRELWDKIRVNLVVKKNGINGDTYTVTNGNQMYYSDDLLNDAGSPDGTSNESLPLSHFVNSDLIETLLRQIKNDETTASSNLIYRYFPYGHSIIGTFELSLEKTVNQAAAEDDAPKQHETKEKGQEKEVYTLKVTYTPLGDNASTSYDHTTSGKSAGKVADGYDGTTGDRIDSENVHKIHVFAKDLEIQKKDMTNTSKLIDTAKFKLYRTAKKVVDPETGQETSQYESGTVDLKVGNETKKVVQIGDEMTTSGGKITVEDLSYAPDGVYYLEETKAPDGYIMATEPIEMHLYLDDAYTHYLAPHGSITEAQTVNNPYNWTQTVNRLVYDSSKTAVVDDSKITIEVLNNPGVELPATGGPGTRLFTILGSILILGAGVLLWRRRRLI